MKDKGLTRRDFVKFTGLGAVAAVSGIKKALAAGTSLKGKRIAMVIDLQRCTGCGGCMLACKNENNVQEGIAWSYRIQRTTGKFPNVRYEYLPTLCNHCEKAPCVRICPTGAMHKGEGDVTAHDPEKCIGCKSCIAACPYKVISRNSGETHKFWRDSEKLLGGCTQSAEEVARAAKGQVIPFYNPDREAFRAGSGLRYKGIAEKCTFCDHRLKRGLLPWCVDRCPAKARVVGDLNDPKSKVNEILSKYRPMRLREHLGTEPKVFYVRDFNAGNYKKSFGTV
jgi:molybdopterin-containing oxidoreductase family iron-sulfur binding subunit